MSTVGGTSNSNTATGTSNAINQAFSNLGPADFLQMMITELQNQNPLDPTNTSDMLSEFKPR